MIFDTSIFTYKYVNHLGTLVITIDDKSKSGAEYGSETIIDKSDVFVRIQILKPTDAVFKEKTEKEAPFSLF
jgi:hypothetical protein